MSKSDQIRDLLGEQPDLSPKEVQTELASRGVQVSRNLCKVVKHRLTKGNQPKRSRQDRNSPRRSGEEYFGSAGIRRLSEHDLAVFDLIRNEVEAIPQEKRHRFLEFHIELLSEVRQWLGAVSTRRARKRRSELLNGFIESLKLKYPPPIPSSKKVVIDTDISAYGRTTKHK